MKAQMKTGLIDLYKKVNPDCIDEEVREFLTSIEGKEVELTFTEGDAFEKNDDSIWLPDELWDPIQ